ncbi:MAG: ribosome recycling factor [Simkaniaceae bacterium]|nr:ribosome recycling factor [Simkaniaceae bacterium]
MTVKQEAKTHMDMALEHFKKELKNLRTSRANPGMLDDVMVDVYGSEMNIKSLATVTVAEARQLVVTPFDPQTVGAIGKSIEKANLGLMPIVEGNLVRVPVPPLNEEVRKDIVKLGKKKLEEAKVSIRDARRKANELARKLKSDGELTEDALKGAEKQVQELTDNYCKQLDQLFTEKEADILAV